MKVLILCGGQGSRAYPYTKTIPKALLPVAGLPAVEQVMRIYAAQGSHEFVLSIGSLGEQIVRYFDNTSWNVEFVDTGKDTDTAGRIRGCLQCLGDTFHATYCDGLGDVDIRALAEFHRRHDAGATLTSTVLRSQYGVIRTDAEERVVEFVEKPLLPEHWINAGFFVFDREAFAECDGDNLERDVLPAMAKNKSLRAFRHRGFWRSMDTHKDQQELNRLWRPFLESFGGRIEASEGSIPDWLADHYEVIEQDALFGSENANA